MMRLILCQNQAVLVLCLWLGTTATVSHAFSVKSSGSILRTYRTTLTSLYAAPEDDYTTPRNTNMNANANMIKTTKAAVAGALFSSALILSPLNQPAIAYDQSDYASDTVQEVVRSLQESKGNPDKTFAAFEEIAAIITEGKGVGGEINYKGVALDRGYISDEDTAIYNPGLTLLTESEKERLVAACIESRKAGLATKKGWNDTNQGAFNVLKGKLDPLHMTELRGYLGVFPKWSAFLYVVVLAVQQFKRDLFPPAYFIAAGLLFVPAIGLIVFAS